MVSSLIQLFYNVSIPRSLGSKSCFSQDWNGVSQSVAQHWDHDLPHLDIQTWNQEQEGPQVSEADYGVHHRGLLSFVLLHKGLYILRTYPHSSVLRQRVILMLRNVVMFCGTLACLNVGLLKAHDPGEGGQPLLEEPVLSSGVSVLRDRLDAGLDVHGLQEAYDDVADLCEGGQGRPLPRSLVQVYRCTAAPMMTGPQPGLVSSLSRRS